MKHLLNLQHVDLIFARNACLTSEYVLVVRFWNVGGEIRSNKYS